MKRIISMGRVAIAQGKHSLTEARKVMDDFVGVKELHAAQQKVKEMQKKISVAEAKRSEYELDLANIRKRIAMLNTEKTHLTGVLDAKSFEVQTLQHQLTQAMILEKNKRHQLVLNRGLVRLMLTIMLYLF